MRHTAATHIAAITTPCFEGFITLGSPFAVRFIANRPDRLRIDAEVAGRRRVDIQPPAIFSFDR